MVSIGTVRNREYWRERFQQLEEALHRKGTDIAQYIIKQYQLALRNMDRELAMWYQRFAENNGISFYGAKKMLTANELSEFHMSVAEYIEIAQQENLSEEWKRKLENAYLKSRVSRLESLQIALQSSIEQLFKQQSDTLDTELPSVYDSSYYHVAFEIQKGFELGTTFQGVDENKLKAVLSRPWAADGKAFSDRIWEHKNNLINALNLEMTQAVIRGDDYRGAAAKIQNKMRVSQGAAMRLVMTESAFIASQAQHDCFKSLDVAQYEFIATLDRRTSDICRSMDRKHFKMSDFKPGTTAPPMHPNCRSCTAPYFGDEVDVGRAARGSDGKTFHVPGDMSYEEWRNKISSKENLISADKNDIITLKGRKLPIEAEPGAIYALKSSKTGHYEQIRFFDSSGKADRDLDLNYHSRPDIHEFFIHSHKWKEDRKKLLFPEKEDVIKAKNYIIERWGESNFDKLMSIFEITDDDERRTALRKLTLEVHKNEDKTK